jgi:prepilin-type N-terminal cleavage/methylation domain-containing protein
MKKNKHEGFTLIELLVVIAIIGILSAIVLADLSTARQKGGDAKVQEQLSNIRNAAEIYFSSNGNSYGSATDCTTGVFADSISGMANLVATSSYPSATTVLCVASTTTYAVTASLSSSTAAWWCVDSTGASKQEPDSDIVDSGLCE